MLLLNVKEGRHHVVAVGAAVVASSFQHQVVTVQVAVEVFLAIRLLLIDLEFGRGRFIGQGFA